MTEEFIKNHELQYSFNKKGWLDWPDYCGRIYRNEEEIRWEGRIHEGISGWKESVQLPAEEEYSMEEGTCGYAPGGEVDVNNTDKMTPAGPDLIKIKIQEVIKKELKKLKK